MHLGQVTTAISEVLGVSSASLTVVTRAMREAGHIATGSRGRHAHHVTDLELSRIMIALLSSESPAEAVRRYVHFASLPIDPATSRFDRPEHLPKVETFELGLAAVFSAVRKSPQIAAPDPAQVTLDVTGSSARITLPQDNIIMRYEPPDIMEVPPFHSALRRESGLSGHTIIALAALGA